MRRWLLWLPFAVFALVLAFAIHGLREPADRTVHSRMVGERLPSFALPPLVPGKPGLASAGLRGKPHLLNVFASWCIPCAAEAPQLLALQRQGVEVDAVVVRDSGPAVQGFLMRYGDPYAAIGADPEGRVQLALGSSGVPESFVVDGAGRIVSQHIGDIRAEDVPDILVAIGRAQ